MRAAVFNADNLLSVGVIVDQSSRLSRVWLFFVSVICSAVQAEWQSSFNSNNKFLATPVVDDESHLLCF